MPYYDFICPACGSVTTARASGVSSPERPCPSCPATAKRSPINRVAVSGFAFVPYDQRPIHLDRAINAQHDLVDEAERTGVPQPDYWAEAKRRVKTGQAQAEAGTR